MTADIVARLHAEIAWEPDVGELLRQAADEIERLRLTDAEREAIGGAMVCVKQIGPAHLLSTLRGLLDRTSNG